MIFVDTSVFVAGVARRDAQHAEAVELLERHASSGLVTSNHVRGETWTFLNRRYGHPVAVRFLTALERTNYVSVLAVGHDLEDRALGWLRRHDEREYSFVDGTSFALMRSLRIREALSFDADFDAAGFVTLHAP